MKRWDLRYRRIKSSMSVLSRATLLATKRLITSQNVCITFQRRASRTFFTIIKTKETKLNNTVRDEIKQTTPECFFGGNKNRESNGNYSKTQGRDFRVPSYGNTMYLKQTNHLTLLEVNMFLLILGELKHLKEYLRK